MAEKEIAVNEEEELEPIVVEFEDEDGGTYLYEQEMIIPVNGEKYALLVGLGSEEECNEHEHEHGCDCGCGADDEDVIIAKIVVNADGEEEYVEPTDEEFEAVQKAYDAIMDEEDAQEQG